MSAKYHNVNMGEAEIYRDKLAMEGERTQTKNNKQAFLYHDCYTCVVSFIGLLLLQVAVIVIIQTAGNIWQMKMVTDYDHTMLV